MADTIIYNVKMRTPKGREGYYVRYPDGIMSNLQGNVQGGWLDAGFPVVEWNQNGAWFDALYDYSANKMTATANLAIPPKEE